MMLRVLCDWEQKNVKWFNQARPFHVELQIQKIYEFADMELWEILKCATVIWGFDNR